jgi:hypothetical protein
MFLTLTPSTWALLERLLVAQLLNNFPTLYGTRTFIIVFTRALHWANTTQYLPPHCIPLWSALIKSSHVHLRLHLPNDLLPSFWLSHQNPICIPPHCLGSYIPCPSHPPRLHHSNYTWQRAKVTKILIMQFSLTSYHSIPPRIKYSS